MVTEIRRGFNASLFHSWQLTQLIKLQIRKMAVQEHILCGLVCVDMNVFLIRTVTASCHTTENYKLKVVALNKKQLPIAETILIFISPISQNFWILSWHLNEWMNGWCIYIALYCVLLYTRSALQSCGGSLLNHHQWAASTWMMRWLPQDSGASALTTHQLQVERRESHRANQVDGDY